MRRRQFLLGAVAVSAGVLAAPSPVTAAPVLVTAAPVLVTNPAQADRDFARWLSVHDPREGVRSAARSALDTGGATAFLASGYASAVDRAARARTGHLDFANRMAAEHTPQSYPWVHAAARRAAIGTDAELAEFAATGYPAALQKDQAKVPYDDGAAQVTDEDRDLAASLGGVPLGATVQERAADLTTDAGIAEFLRHGLLSAAGIDADTHRAQYVAHEWAQWNEARQLTLQALAAEESGDPDAVAWAWQTVTTRFPRQPSGWSERERLARNRADAWAWLAAGATRSETLLQASAVREQWLSETTTATERSTWWTELLRYALSAA
ncbi:hypothetical protein [Paractinoplanes deccanensis]|uniref:hypothetical protein n=1 Tax=Paractinoplanes deccanensis TaxID=113561 RepID=UPI0019418BAF|nr:hypothetical protein [Actinoplanes deccanensis]